MGTIRFILRTDKPGKELLCPVQLIYQLSGKRKYFTTKGKLRAENWDPDKQIGIYRDKKAAKLLLPAVQYSTLPSSKDIEQVNLDLSDLKKQVTRLETRFEANNIIYSVEMIIDELNFVKKPTTKKEAASNQLFDFIDKYINANSESRVKGSLSVYKSLKTHLSDYQRDKKKKVIFDAINYSFFQDFQNYLIIPRDKLMPSKNKDAPDTWKTISLNNTTIAKQLSTLKTFLNYARMNGIEVKGNYKDFKIKKETLEVIALTNEEFEKLINLDMKQNKRLDQVRDVFCFSCSTGLRFSDLSQLRREHIKKDEIRLTVTKTKRPLLIPLNPYSNNILAKYSGQHKPIPVISNQKTNEYLKELCKLAGIDEPIEIVRFRGAVREAIIHPKYELVSVHTGRKTFCTLSLEKGMSAEEVMQISGHRDYQSFKRYVKITEARTKIVMRNAWGSVPKVQLQAV
jgi:integrase